MMIRNDMKKRMNIARAKVAHALELGGGHTILSTGMTGDDARLARAVCEAGVTMLEPNHPAVALARGHKGVVTMHAAEQVRHEITVAQMAEVTRGVRAVCPKDTYITVGIPGGFTEVVPMPLTEADFQMMALAGADGLHTHKSSIEDLEELVTMAGGINATNFRAFKDTKVNSLVIGTSIDKMVEKAAQDAVREFLAM